MCTSKRLTSRPAGLSACGRITTLMAALVLVGALPAPAGAICACLVVDNGTHVIGPGQQETHDCMTIGSYAVLIIKGTLTLTGQCTSVVTGVVRLKGSAAKLEFTDHHTVSGSGQIRGYAAAARITIASGKTLTSTTNITGKLEITGEGNFANSGIVEADANGTLAIKVGGTLSDGNNADRWKVAANAAVLQFASTIGTISTLDGNFVMTTGNSSSKIIFDHALTTNGGLEMSVGVVDVNENVTMGKNDPSGVFLDMTGGQIQVGTGKTFTHN